MAVEYNQDGAIPAILNIDMNQVSPVLQQVVDAINGGQQYQALVVSKGPGT